MTRAARVTLLILATILLVGAAFMAAHEMVPGAVGLLVLATLAATFERMLSVQGNRE